jgi:hypothetical protein
MQYEPYKKSNDTPQYLEWVSVYGEQTLTKPKIHRIPAIKRLKPIDDIDFEKIYNPYELIHATPMQQRAIYTGNQLLSFHNRTKRAQTTERNKMAEFGEWQQLLRNEGYDIPTWSFLQQLPLPYAKQKISGMAFAYAVYRFNLTHNTGTSITNDVTMIRRLAHKYGIFVQTTDFPWLGDLKRGCDAIVEDHDNRKKGTKLGIFHPLLEKMSLRFTILCVES